MIRARAAFDNQFVLVRIEGSERWCLRESRTTPRPMSLAEPQPRYIKRHDEGADLRNEPLP